MRYAELHCRTNFSFLEGAAHPEELVGRAVSLNYAALAVTDRNTLAGVVRAHVAAKAADLKLIIGAEITPLDAPAVVLWAPDRQAYGQLCRLITRGRRNAAKGECYLTLTELADHTAGLLAGIETSPSLLGVRRHDRPDKGWPKKSTRKQGRRITSCGKDSLDAGVKRNDCQANRPLSLLHALHVYHDIFGDRGYLLTEPFAGPDDQGYLDQQKLLAQQVKLPLVAAGDVYYHVPGRMPLHDVLTAIRHGTTVAAAEGLLLPNAQRHLKALDVIANVFAAIPDAVQRSVQIADRCTFSLDELRYEYPEELVPSDLSSFEYLSLLAWKGAQRRYPRGVPDKVQRLLEHELHLIRELHYEAYFLTVWDLVQFARGHGILCQGRGSAANSAVCYCLGVTSVDPNQTDVLFERFVSRERDEAPDIDVDFEHERREEVIQYVYEKYGRERSGMTAEVIRYRPRSAIRDVGQALGLSRDRVQALANNLEGCQYDSDLSDRCRQVNIDPDTELGQRLVYLVKELIGFPRHLSQHVGGMVVTQGPLCELVPIENAAMEGRTVIQWDKNDLEELGILKVDCLALGMLTAIHRCFDLVRQQTGCELTLASVPAGDQQVYDMICQADTIGVFQIESRAQMTMLPRLKPRCYYDLVIEVAIVRPGPIQGKMVHPYLRRRWGEERVTYPNDAIRQVLEKTLGVPLFQEQAMRLAVVAAGFTPGEADQLRRAMGDWRNPDVLDCFRQKLLEGMRCRGLSEAFAEAVFRQICGFGGYGFPESHAASFALLVYVSAWLKFHYPAAFTTALINSQPMGFYAPAQLLRDARGHGVQVQPIDVNVSHWDCVLETTVAAEDGDHQHSMAIRLGLRLIIGFSKSHADLIVQARQQGRFCSMDDFYQRTGLTRTVVMKLASADALRSLTGDRRVALWKALARPTKVGSQPLFDSLSLDEELPQQLQPTTLQADVFGDYQSTGLSLRSHPVSFWRARLDRMHVKRAEQLSEMVNHEYVAVAGLVLLRQRPSTAKGMTFVTLEDETGIVNLVVHQPTWQRYYRVTRHAPAWLVYGRVECKDTVIHVIVRCVKHLAESLGELKIQSRDFR